MNTVELGRRLNPGAWPETSTAVHDRLGNPGTWCDMNTAELGRRLNPGAWPDIAIVGLMRVGGSDRSGSDAG